MPTKTAARSARPRYAPHPMLSRERGMDAQLEKATGRSLKSWIALARKQGLPKQKDCAAWLAKEHALKPMQAAWIASYAFSSDDPADYDDPEKLVDELFSGPRAAVRPIHEKVVDAVLALGEDVVVTSCKTMVPFYRKHVFAETRPVEGGVELSLALGDVPVAGRLEASRKMAPGDRIAHRVLLRSSKDVDAEVRGWLAKAYELGAGKIARAASVETPPDVAKAIRASKPAAATWAACTPAMQRDFVVWITSAKQAETRTRRIGQAVEKLAAGKKKMY
jgi:hypothetical protein